MIRRSFDGGVSQRGITFLECLILVAFVMICLAFIFGTGTKEWKEACLKAGGIPVVGRYDNVCYAPGTVIPINR